MIKKLMDYEKQVGNSSWIFFGKRNTMVSNFTGINWGVPQPELEKRKIRIAL